MPSKEHVSQILTEIFGQLPITGGVGDGHTPDEFDKVNLALGILVEMEHTTDCLFATKIAIDHLVENKNYYIIYKNTELWHDEEIPDRVVDFIRQKTGLDIRELVKQEF